MGQVDLHIHSIYSDGENTPEEIFNLAKEKGLTTIAITDHNNINGSKELIKKVGQGINIYSGVELTAKVSKGSMHILGYNFYLYNEKINKRLNEMREASKHNILLYIDVLKKDFNIIITPEEIDELFKAVGNLGRPQLALLLIKKGLCNSVSEAFDKYLIHANTVVKKEKISLGIEECIDLINSSEGIPILAHPNSLKLDAYDLERAIIHLKDMGLKGLETTHSDLNSRQREYYHYLARKHLLLESGGTDYHGHSVKPNIDIGSGISNNVDIKENTLTLTNKYIKNRYL